MRITYLNASGQMGGAETSLLELLASVKAAQPQWELSLVLGEDGPFATKVRALGIPTRIAEFPGELARFGDSELTSGSFRGSVRKVCQALAAFYRTVFYARKLSKTIAELKPDLIHSTGFKMHILAVWARVSGAPVIWHIHDYVSSRPVMRKLLRFHAGRCAAIIVNSKSVRRDVVETCPAASEVTVIYNSLDLERFSPSGATLDLDAAAGLPAAAGGTLRVGLPATFAKWKGHPVFLKALSLLPARLRVRGYIIGGPIYQTSGSQFSLQELREEASRLGLGERVGFTGFVDRPETAMRALDVVVHASTQPEPFGMVIVEAMACGKAAVASSSSGASELFSDGEEVLAYTGGNAYELAERIQSLAEDAKLRARLGKAGRQSVETVLRGSRLAAELEAVYRRVVRRS